MQRSARVSRRCKKSLRFNTKSSQSVIAVAIRAALFAVEDRYLAEDFPGIDYAKYDFFALVGK
jgi:hypothetical protein